MLKSLKIFLIVFGLGVFTFPKQVFFEQQTEQCCNEKPSNEDCCNSEKAKSCHSENPDQKDDCRSSCNSCHSCSVHFVLNYVSTEVYDFLEKPFFSERQNFSYQNSFFSSQIHNIWQPPKIG